MQDVVSKLPSIEGYGSVAQICSQKGNVTYRAVDDDGQCVEIKTWCSDSLEVDGLLRIRNHFNIASGLTGVGFVKPLSLQVVQRRLALVSVDVGAIALRDFLSNHGRLPIGKVLAIALQATSILQTLAMKRVVHKCIQPSSFSIHPETHELWLTDFSFASVLPRQETNELRNRDALEGTLAYIAPEQTGRMNRGVDFRADFYSLGVTLYELLTGQLPFQSNDPLELIHCHLAKTPTPPCELRPADVPKSLSDVVLKLMAKNAEDRYQSAAGIGHDLQHCVNELREKGTIEAFELGQQDWCDRFLIPETLYGRDAEMKSLLDSFERVAGGAAELVLVAGFSGVGKTAVVNEVHKPIVAKRGYFVEGKFDQLHRNVPFSGFVQAFRGLMRQLFGESESRMLWWKARILNALKDNGQILIDVVPELETIIGSQPPVPELEGAAARNRFQLLMEQFVAVFATEDHPLVMFLDDLHWADSASLNLLQVLLDAKESGHVLLLGAYRDNEVSETHPLMRTIGELQTQQTAVSTITLSPLANHHVNQLVAVTLSCTSELAMPLTELVYQQTKGNPFFTIQFLKGLYDDGLITFDRSEEHWECDLVRVRDAVLTDDVVEYMAVRLHKLPEETQHVLKLAACIGNEFDIDTLATICECSSSDVAQDLWSSLQEGFVLPQSQAYKFFQGDKVKTSVSSGQCENEAPDVAYRFLHDRVQQAAYSLIPEDQKQATHYRIGSLLNDQLAASEGTEGIFDVVNHLNAGRQSIGHRDDQRADLRELVLLNLRAGKKAKTSTAYDAAHGYFEVALDLIPDSNWQEDYPLTLQLHEHAAEAAYYAGHPQRMEELVGEILRQAADPSDTAIATSLKIQKLIGQNQPQSALRIGLELLPKLGVDVPPSPSFEDVQSELASFREFAAEFSPAEIAKLPQAEDPKDEAIFRTIQQMLSAAIIVDPNLFHSLTLTFTRLTLERGLSSYSPHCFCGYAIQLVNLHDDIQAGFDWGQLAISMVDSSATNAINSIAYENVGAFLHHGKCHLRETLPFLRDAREVGLQHGDFEHPGYAVFVECQNLYFLGTELGEVDQRVQTANSTLVSIGQNLPLSWNACHEQAVNRLRGVPARTLNAIGEVYRYEKYVETKHNQGDSFGLFFVHFNEAILSFIFGETDKALVASSQARDFINGPTGLFCETVFYFYDSLIRLANAEATRFAGSESADVVVANQARMRLRADYAPMNYQHKFDLVEAEQCRVLGRKLEAMDHYDRAIAGAQEHEFLHEEALANELAGSFYLDWGKEKLAVAFLKDAYDCYERWGAIAKTNDLRARYAELLKPVVSPSHLPLLGTLQSSSLPANASDFLNTLDNAALDMATVLKSSRALSESIDLDELLERLARMMLQTSGAERLALLLPDANDVWHVRVHATVEAIQKVQQPLLDHPDLPVELIQSVLRSQTTTAVDHANQLSIADSYLKEHPRRSIRCVPLLHRSKLVGVLYLDHASLDDVFNCDRITVVDFLCDQAAISLENALLTRALERELEVQTEKVRSSADALRESESKFKRLVEGVADVIWATDANHNLTYLSPQFERTFGLDPADWIGLPPFELIHPEDREGVRERAIVLHKTGTNKQGNEYRHLCADGNWVWIAASSVAVFDASGRVIAHQGAISNISERKEAEIALQEAQLQLQNMTENVPGMIYRYIVHPDGMDEVTSVSSQVREIFELEPEAALKDASVLWSRIHPDDVQEIRNDILDSAESLVPFDSAYRLVLPEKGTRWVQHMSSVERLENGDVVWDGIVSDITDRKRIESETQRQLAIIESTSDFVGTTDPDGNILFLNQAWKTLLKKEGDEAAPRKVIADQHPAWATELIKNQGLPAAIEFGMWEGETAVLDGNGREVPVSQVIIAHKTCDGDVEFFSTIIRDITERKNAELRLQKANGELARATKMKDEFLANMSHELRTPLSAILGMTEGLQQGIFGPVNQKQASGYEVIQESGSHLLGLINEVLDLAKIESGSLGLDLAKTEVNKLCKSSLQLVAQQAKKKSIDLQLNVPFNLPAMEVDEKRVRQILVNLLSNAVKFTPDGGRVTLEVKGLPPNEKKLVRFSVKDTGVGIDESKLESLFEPFVQVDTSLGREYEGTGLGLALVKQFTELHAGTYGVTSEVGVGSCFYVEFPIRQSDRFVQNSSSPNDSPKRAK